MARGGQRAGTPGKAYAQRTDLHQPVTVAPGQEYGGRKMLENAQKVVPLPEQPPTPSPSPPAAGAASPAMPAGPQPGLSPGELDFTRPTERPNEPVTAGLPVGPGPGPEALNLPSAAGQTAMQLSTIYANVPQAQNPDFLRLVRLAQAQAWQ